MKKLDLNFKLTDLDGNVIEGGEVNKLFAGLLMSQKNGDAVKFFDWAVTVNKTGVIEVDSSDFSLIKELVKNNDGYLTVLSKAQLLNYLETIK